MYTLLHEPHQSYENENVQNPPMLWQDQVVWEKVRNKDIPGQVDVESTKDWPSKFTFDGLKSRAESMSYSGFIIL